MQVIIIGAGRGARLMPTTADTPKCFSEVEEKRILDWTIEAFLKNDIDRFCFIGGYQIDKVREDYPQLNFRDNVDWPKNNILVSLFYAEDVMEEPFICCYSDVLFTPRVVESLLASDEDIALAVDTAWLERYEHRTEHPTGDAEKVTVQDGVVTRVHREIGEAETYGEYIGVAKFSLEGARKLKHHYHRCRELYWDKPFREAKLFQKAYKIHLFQEMIEAGERIVHVDTPGGYIEVDTQQDFEYARQYWKSRHLGR
ncbi:MAG: phosphocholine cytidylyltransferase family protein [Planctomycetes bacterium]|nr:phosphocholine cytidylyltransferase family protein [Planctomycetota bacterium]